MYRSYFFLSVFAFEREPFLKCCLTILAISTSEEFSKSIFSKNLNSLYKSFNSLIISFAFSLVEIIKFLDSSLAFSMFEIFSFFKLSFSFSRDFLRFSICILFFSISILSFSIVNLSS